MSNGPLEPWIGIKDRVYISHSRARGKDEERRFPSNDHRKEDCVDHWREDPQGRTRNAAVGSRKASTSASSPRRGLTTRLAGKAHRPVIRPISAHFGCVWKVRSQVPVLPSLRQADACCVIGAVHCRSQHQHTMVSSYPKGPPNPTWLFTAPRVPALADLHLSRDWSCSV